MSLRGENLRPGGKVLPSVGCERERREQEMQRRRIALGGQPGSLRQRIQANVHISWPIAAEFASGGENEMLFAFEPENLGRWRNVKSVPIGIIGRANLRAVRLRAANTRHDQVLLMNEPVLGDRVSFGVSRCPHESAIPHQQSSP